MSALVDTRTAQQWIRLKPRLRKLYQVWNKSGSRGLQEHLAQESLTPPKPTTQVPITLDVPKTEI